MSDGRGKLVVGLGIIIILVLLGFATYSVLKPALPHQTTPSLTLLDYIKRPESQVRYTIEGPVTANEGHDSIVIAVSHDNRTVQVLESYNNQPTATQTFDNNQAAYEDFMTALNNAGFIKRNQQQTSEVGACPSGERYIYELIDSGNTVSRTWSSSCGGGNFNGSPASVRQLFQAQIPGYSKITADASFAPQQ